MKKLLKILGTVVISLVALVLIAVLVFRAVIMLPVSSYYSASEKAFVIPGLSDNFVPQGFHYDAEKGYFIISGYDSKDNASPIYLVDKQSGETVKRVELYKENGEIFTGHSGGVALFGDNLYVAGGGSKCIFVFSYKEVLENDKATCKGKFMLKASEADSMSASFVTVSGNRLVVGEYRGEPQYTTPESHYFTTASGEFHGALALEFNLSDEFEYGIDPEPSRAYTIRDKVQGLEIANGKIYLSTSWGISHSVIYEYDESKLVNEGTVNIIGKTLPLYSLDSVSLLNEYTVAPMSEELVMLDGKLYIMCESACNKYIFGKLTDGKWCYATDLEEMKK
ncbi:MAG: hypothetical protein IJD95_00660 [Clostridia bacterium]|nr:hypothetical protein [Clostridia bacterium]